MPPAIGASLQAHRARQNLELADPEVNQWGLVFTRADGEPLDGTVVTHQFQRLLAAAGLPQRRFHDLRHSCATLLLAQGVSARVVMDVLGHSQIGLTMNTYTHVLIELKRDAAERMNDLMLDC
jgi:integrase